jgi:flagellar biosynthesis/type III secretory pathway protein FliH
MYEWCLAPPDPETIADKNFQDETLNKMLSEYNKNQIYAKEHFEERKRELLSQAAEEAKRAALAKIQEESENNIIDVTENITEVVTEVVTENIPELVPEMVTEVVV